MKRGLSTVITMVIIVLFVIIAIGIIWAFIVPLIEEQGEISEAQAKLISADIGIVSVSGDLVDPTQVSVVIKRGRDDIFKSERVEEIKVDAYIISVADLSSSMGIPLDNPILDLSIEANKNFATNVLNENPNNLFGLVGFRGNYKPLLSHPLTNNIIEITDVIDGVSPNPGWSADAGTCICCGIRQAIVDHNDVIGNAKRVMVVMTDGDSIYDCEGNHTNDPGMSKQIIDDEIIEEARKAYVDNNIRIYTVGFGNNADENLLRNTADIGGGQYYSAATEIGELDKIYNQIFYEVTEIVNLDSHIKIVFYSGSNSYSYNVDTLPEPLGSEAYIVLPFEDLSNYITNIDRIEIYAVIVTDSGREVGKLMDVWES